MSLHLVIDGYNLIRQSRSLRDAEQKGLEEGRQALLERVAAYRRLKGHAVTVVFDGAESDGLGVAKSRWKGIGIRFSRPGELADGVIKRIAAREGERVVVVTSDREVARFAEQQGATTIESLEFEQRMALAVSMESALDDPGAEDGGWVPTTKKKGPPRRRSKRERKKQVKARKL